MRVDRLRKLAKILFTADEKHSQNDEPEYDQGRYMWPCGTPACALGHWAAANPKRWKLKRTGYSEKVPLLREKTTNDPIEDAAKEFGLDYNEVSELFDGDGCGWARTGREAAIYIENFIRRNK